MSTYTQHYSNFIGVDLSSDPRAVARNRLSYAVNMWRDYESEQGEGSDKETEGSFHFNHSFLKFATASAAVRMPILPLSYVSPPWK